MKPGVPSALVLLLLTRNAFADTWLCVAEQSTGFAFKSGQWQHVVFTPNEKYVIRPVKDSDKGSIALILEPKATHILSEIGEKSSTACIAEVPSSDGFDAGFIHCHGFGTEIAFNKKSLRFQQYYSVGYVMADPDSKAGKETQEGNTPSISIGKCSEIK